MQVVDWERGKEAVTCWKILADMNRKAGYTVLELRPLTGRTHQLRLAMSVCGAPILGDRLYAPEDIQGAASRLMLHAEQLRVPRINGPRDDLDIKCPAPFLSTGEV
jgi:tRNA pseudouridine32 synthase/23S rRNA pseudouridine746 synthase